MRNRSVMLGIAILGTVTLTGAARGAWPVVINGAANGADDAEGVAVFSSGDVVISGNIVEVDPGDIFVARLDATTGAEKWRRVLDGSNHNRDTGTRVVLNADEDVYVVGTLTNNPGFTDVDIIKLNGTTGETMWVSNWTGPANNGASYDGGTNVKIDANGDVLAVGWFQRDVPGNFAVDWFAVKVRASDGQGIWSRTVNGGAAPNLDYGRVIAVDPSGNTFISGQFGNAGRYDFAVTKLDAATGVVRWQKALSDGAYYSLVYDMVADAAGDLFAVGIMGSTIQIFTTVKFDAATGATRWKKGAGSGQGKAAVLGANGDVIVVGAAPTPGNVNAFTAIRYAGADGTQRWIYQDPEESVTSGPADEAEAVALDSNGDVLVTGVIDAHLVVQKLSGQSGARQWGYRMGVPPSGFGVPYAIAVDPNGHPAVAGVADFKKGTGNDIVAVRLNGATGIPFGIGCQ